MELIEQEKCGFKKDKCLFNKRTHTHTMEAIHKNSPLVWSYLEQSNQTYIATPQQEKRRKGADGERHYHVIYAKKHEKERPQG